MSDEQNTNTPADTPEQDSPEVVTRARELGWVPETEWKGTPPKNGFLDPAEFVRRGEKIMPIVRAENRKLQERLDRLESERQTERQEHRDTVKRIERMSSVALENQRTQIESRYAERKEAAVEVGDKVAYNQAVKDEKEAVGKLDDRLAEKPDDKDTKGKTPELPKEISDTINSWNADNSWYGTDGEMTAVAQNHHAKMLKEKPGLTLRQNLDAVTEYVKKRYPEKFGDGDEGDEDRPARRGSAVEGGGRLNGGGVSRSLYSKLPAEAKGICDKFIKEDGLFLNRGETVEKNIAQARERYAAQYLGDQT